MSDTQTKITAATKILEQVARPLFQAISFALPVIVSVSSKLWAFYKTLPQNVIRFWTGFIFCFFGGLYPVTFAAIQAAEHGGRKLVVEALSELSDEAIKILEGECVMILFHSRIRRCMEVHLYSPHNNAL
jgi:hypothetical protein